MGAMDEPADRYALVKYLATHCALGIAVGWALAATMVLTGVANLRALIAGADEPLVAVGMLAGAFAVTFGSLAMGTAVMMLGRERS